MTLSEDVERSTQREHSIPVLETKRLTLRAPRHEDVKAIAVLANDRRIAENTSAFRILTGLRTRRNSSPRSIGGSAKPASC
jgi:RimJ/RimL family protein N-acetyltransferase